MHSGTFNVCCVLPAPESPSTRFRTMMAPSRAKFTKPQQRLAKSSTNGRASTARLLGSALLLSHLWLFIRSQLPGFPIGFLIWLLRRVPCLFQKRSVGAGGSVVLGARSAPHRGSAGDRVAIVANEDRPASWDASKLEVPVSELRRLAKVNHMVGTKPSIARRLLRTFIGFFIAAFIGVGATLAWQRHNRRRN